MIRATFLPFEADLILRIPLSHNLPEDKIIQIGNSRGEQSKVLTIQPIICRNQGRKKNAQSGGCPVGSSEVESLDHALLHCAFSTSVWCLWSNNPLHTHGINKSFLDSTIFILSPSYATLQDLELFFAIAWAIWLNRNKIVHKDSSLLPLQV